MELAAQKLLLLLTLPIFLPVILVTLTVLAVLAIALVKSRMLTIRQRRADAEARRERFDEDGHPLPPRGRGLCDACSQAEKMVYFLPEGRRLCADCFEKHRAIPTSVDHREIAHGH